MSVRVGINGFGRIGRQSLKAILERAPELEVVAVNDLVDTSLNALLFKHDSTYGAYPGTVDHTDTSLIIDGREIKVLKETDPDATPGSAGELLSGLSESVLLQPERAKTRAAIRGARRRAIRRDSLKVYVMGRPRTRVYCVSCERVVGGSQGMRSAWLPASRKQEVGPSGRLKGECRGGDRSASCHGFNCPFWLPKCRCLHPAGDARARGYGLSLQDPSQIGRGAQRGASGLGRLTEDRG